MSNFNELYAIDPVARRLPNGTSGLREMHDAADVLVPGRRVRIAGQVASTMHVVAVDPRRSLVAIMKDGHSTHMNSMEGSRYGTSRYLVFKYLTRASGNEVRVILPYTPLFAFPLKAGAGR
jgi:hypothetical protein